MTEKKTYAYNLGMEIDEDSIEEFDEDADLDEASLACEDCDHRWEPDDLDEMICPLCGSENVVEL